MTIAIVDDEYLALNRLKRMLHALGHEDVHDYNSVETFLDYLDTHPFNLIFLDINMPLLSGVEVAKKIKQQQPNCNIIFQTAYKEYAFDAFELQAVDYLLKPYTQEQLEQSIQKVFLLQPRSIELLCKNKTHYTMVKSEEVLYVKASQTEVELRTKEGFFYLNEKISVLEETLKPFGFMKVHRSYLVNRKAITTIETIQRSCLVFNFQGIEDRVTSSKEGAKYFREHYKATK